MWRRVRSHYEYLEIVNTEEKKFFLSFCTLPGTASATIIDFAIDFVVGVPKQMFFLVFGFSGFALNVASRVCAIT